MKVWLGLGSNLEQPVTQLRVALSHLEKAAEVEILKTSSFYRTSPWGGEPQDDFVNAVVQIETPLKPLSLLHLLQSIETSMGRQRKGSRWGPRLIDIDMLLYGDQQYSSKDLVVPHSHMHNRAFVLIPLYELEPTLEIPGHGGIGKHLKQLDCSGILRLNDCLSG